MSKRITIQKLNGLLELVNNSLSTCAYSLFRKKGDRGVWMLYKCQYESDREPTRFKSLADAYDQLEEIWRDLQH